MVSQDTITIHGEFSIGNALLQEKVNSIDGEEEDGPQKEDKSQTNEPNIGRGKIKKNHGMGGSSIPKTRYSTWGRGSWK